MHGNRMKLSHSSSGGSLQKWRIGNDWYIMYSYPAFSQNLNFQKFIWHVAHFSLVQSFFVFSKFFDLHLFIIAKFLHLQACFLSKYIRF